MTECRRHSTTRWRHGMAVGLALGLMVLAEGCASVSAPRKPEAAPPPARPQPAAQAAEAPARPVGPTEPRSTAPITPVPPSAAPLPARPAAPPAAPPREGRTITLNFDNADVPSVVQTLARLLGINYILEPTVGPGRVTIHASGKFAQEELLPILETVLEVNNLAITRAGPLYRIGPLAEAKQRPIEAYVGREPVARGDKVIVQVVPLNYLPASAMEGLLRPIVSKTGTFLPVPGTNSLVVVDVASSVAKLLDVIALLDVNIFDRIQVKLHPVTNVSADDLATELEELYAQLGYARTGREPLRFIPISRLGLILVVNAFPELAASIERWIQALDQPATQLDEGIFVYYVENHKAAALADVLTQLYQQRERRPESRPTGPRPPGAAPAAPAAPTRPPTLGVPAAPAAPTLPGLQPAPGPALTPTPPSGAEGRGPAVSAATPAYPGAPAAATTSTTAGRRPAAGPAGAAPTGDVRILADEATNALIIAAPPRQYPSVLETIRKLDIPKKQVVIETMVAELTLDNTTKFGIEWSLRTSGRVTVGGKDYFVNTTPTANFGTLFTPQAALLGFTSVLTVTDQILGLIRALADANQINVLSSPNILATDNKTATINIGDSIPILTSQTSTAQTTGGTQNVTQTIQYQDTGIILEVTPHINEKRLVVIDIRQEVSNAVKNVIGGTDSPIIQKRTANTSAVVADGQTVLIGGLISEERSQTRSGIPWLSKIPILGYLFGATEDVVKKRELIILITPRVIGDPEDARGVTAQFEGRVKGLQRQLQLAP